MSCCPPADYAFNGGSYHDQPRGPEGGEPLPQTHAGRSFSIALDCGAGTLELFRDGARVGRVASGLSGELSFCVQLLHPDASLRTRITAPAQM